MSRAAIEACNWQEPGGLPEVNRMVDFIEGLGIEVLVDTVPDAEEMGMTIRKGAIIIDPAAPVYPGDLLHEAGHLAVADPEQRAMMEQMSDDPGEEMAAIAWSAAATVPCEITLEVLFHDMGYRGHAASLRMNFSQGNFLGVPMLAMWEMTSELHRTTPDMPAYPRMTRWMRGGDPVA